MVGDELELEERVDQPSAPALLVELEPRFGQFLENLRDLAWTPYRPPLHLRSWPAAPWPDIFVPTGMPWKGFGTSLAAHGVALALLLAMISLAPSRRNIADRPTLRRNQIVYYSPAEYLAQLDTGRAAIQQGQKGEPELSPQPIISVPPEADNHVQTIVTPPNVKLNRDVPLPNIVAWNDAQPSMPLAATAREVPRQRTPSLGVSVVAPAPSVDRDLSRRAQSLNQPVVAPAPQLEMAAGRQALQAPQAEIVAPAPQVRADNVRNFGDLNIGRSAVVAPAPQLPVSEQRIASRSGPLTGGSSVVPPPPSLRGSEVGQSGAPHMRSLSKGSEVVPPPPSMQSSTGDAGGGRLIALNVRPLAPDAAAEIPSGNRRGSFASTPEGTPGARGTPQISGNVAPSATGGNGSGGAVGVGSDKASGAPPGLFVGAAPKGQPAGASLSPSTKDTTPNMMASVTVPRVSTPAGPKAGTPVENPTPVERQVFGDRKFYRMNVNMPNLNSSGGSWVIRFAELKDYGEGELSSPVATTTSDPAYPTELIRHNVSGTVTLKAVIHSDGSVSDVSVVDSVDDRLDRFASAALERWKFRPATKNGSPVALEALVVIPFRPSRSAF